MLARDPKTRGAQKQTQWDIPSNLTRVTVPSVGSTSFKDLNFQPILPNSNNPTQDGRIERTRRSESAVKYMC